MDFQVGKKYLTRNGAIARILATNLKGLYPIVAAYIRTDSTSNHEQVETFSIDGSYDKKIGEHKLDLVAEYFEIDSESTVEQDKPALVLEVGKKYRTIEGNIVRIICTDANDADYPVIGLVAEEGHNKDRCETFTKDGKLLLDRNLVENIVAEYIEPESETEKIVPWSLKNHPTGAVFVKVKEIETEDENCESIITTWYKGGVHINNVYVLYSDLLNYWIQSNGNPCGWDETL